MARCPACFRRLSAGQSCPKDGKTPIVGAQEPEAELPDSIGIPDFEIVRPLGAGGFAVVCLAKRRSDGQMAALKIMTKSRQEHVERFKNEEAALRTIGAPYVPRVIESGVSDNGRHYIAMEHIQEPTLASYLEEATEAPTSIWIQSTAGAILESLQAAHSHGLVHRDLKPENIFLPAPNSSIAKILDFGLVKALDHQGQKVDLEADLTRTGTVVGSLEYMAPEQLKGLDCDARTDIYAFGIILFEMLTGRPPFVGSATVVERGHLALRPPRLREVAGSFSSLDGVLSSCLAKEPDQRPESIQHLSRALNVAWRTRPASAPSLESTTLLAEAQQPIILLLVETEAPMNQINKVVNEHRGFVARHRGRQTIGAFSPTEMENPAALALSAAERLLDTPNTRVAVHLEGLRVRKKSSGPPSLYGRPLEHPKTWLPEGDWSGIQITQNVAHVLPEDETKPSKHPGFFVLANADETTSRRISLVGCEKLATEVKTSFRTCLEERSPGLFTVLGGAGLGKSRVAREIPKWLTRKKSSAPIRVMSVQAKRATNRADKGSLSAAVQALEKERGQTDPPAKRTLGERLCEAARVEPLALILDDAHLANDASLDAVEFATLDATELPLWVVVIASHKLLWLRDHWGMGAHRHERAELSTLEKKDAMKLAAELLKPAEFPPADFLERLSTWTGGHPFYLTQLVRTLKRQGIVKKRANAPGYYVSTAEFERLPASAVGQWLITRELSQMLPELASCVRLCSVLGAEFALKELKAVQKAAEEDGAAATTVDPQVGLEELTSLDVLEQTEDGFSFRSAVFQDGVYKLLGKKDRVRIHRYAADYWRNLIQETSSRRSETLESLARHAAASKSQEEATDLYLELGKLALDRHRHSEAERHFSAVLDCGPSPEATAIASLGRGRARVRSDRIHDALADFKQVRTIAKDSGNNFMLAESFLEEATGYDFLQDYESSNRAIEEIRPMIEASDDAILKTRLMAADGRSASRIRDVESMVKYFAPAAAEAERLGDYETQVVSMLLLGPALALTNRLDEAEACMKKVIALCESTGDKFHLATAHVNRMTNREVAGQVDEAVTDLRVAIQIARELGHPRLERWPTGNLAEIWYFIGEFEKALPLAERSLALQKRFDSPVSTEASLLARVQGALGHYDKALETVAWFAAHCRHKEEGDERLMDTLLLALPALDAGEYEKKAWEEINLKSEGCLPAVLVEIRWWQTRCALGAKALEDAQAAFSQSEALLEQAGASWGRRMEALRLELQEAVAGSDTP